MEMWGSKRRSRRSAALWVAKKFLRGERITAVPAEALTFVITDEIEPRLKARLAQAGREVIEAGKASAYPRRSE